MITIDFSKVVAYSKSMCYSESHHLCATYVKRAFEKGGCTYISGNGWSNQKWCETNGFKLIGDFIPVDMNPRAHNGKPIQFPSGYVQQTGDVCLIKHGTYGHICYAMSADINSWVSDYFQRPPGQQAGTGPYCYTGSVERVQFWRHESVLNNAPVITNVDMSYDTYERNTNYSYSSSSSSSSYGNGLSNEVKRLASAGKAKENVMKLDDSRQREFESLVTSMTNGAPQMGREILVPTELYDSNILKGSQESTKERT